MKKTIQLISIGLAAYNLYVLVDDFLKTPVGKSFKAKAIEYAEPIYNEGKEKAKDFAEKVVDKLKDEVPIPQPDEV